MNRYTPQIEAYIRQEAVKRNIDPDIAVEVARREALNVFDPSQPDLGGDDRSSFGPFQLHYAGLSSKMPNAGVGDDFTRATGLDARNPATWPQQVSFALDQARKSGWGKWMGAAAGGIGDWAGIGGHAAGPRGGTAPVSVLPPNLAAQFGQAAATGAGQSFGDAVAPQAMQQAGVAPPSLPNLALTFLQQAEERRQREAEQDQKRRQALFAPTVAVAPSSSLAGLYG